MTGRVYNTAQVAALTGLTIRHLDRYCTAGAFGPCNARPGSGGRREFDSQDLFTAAVLAELLPLGGLLSGTNQKGLSTTLAAEIACVIQADGRHHHVDGRGKYLYVDVNGVTVRGSRDVTAAVVVDLYEVECRLAVRLAEAA